MASCSALGLTVGTNNTCVECSVECDNTGCTGGSASECRYCADLQLRDECVSECPKDYFISSIQSYGRNNMREKDM